MPPLIQQISTAHTPESFTERLRGQGTVLLRGGWSGSPQSRYSFVAARPFLSFRSFGSRCELVSGGQTHVQFGNPWRALDSLMARYELLDEMDLPYPLGGCFGFWGYDLKSFVEPKLSRRAINDLELPECAVGFYDTITVFDHRLEKTWIVSTGLDVDGSRDESRAKSRLDDWAKLLNAAPAQDFAASADRLSEMERCGFRARAAVTSNISRDTFLGWIDQAQRYIRAGDIYQVNLSHRLCVPCPWSGWETYQRLAAFSPAPFAAFLDCGEFQIASSSPELFLQLSGSHILTRPIKGTRPRSADPNRDAQLNYELQTSPKEMAELVMITDLLRNDLGKVCDFGSVQVPELVRLERFAQVQHLVSTVEGQLRRDVTHFAAFASCFPGGSITGAPKFRAMEIIDELEPIARGPYTGALGFLGFNRESRLSILIRSAVCREQMAYFNVGAGIVADSIPEAEYDETLAKAGGFIAAMERNVWEPRMDTNEHESGNRC
ncbi:MAG: anthranilate synthase component I family protein [Verrucomicrobia bacterium]|nr:anthranilate synthase component I family protein [Verrucomicrobiota bacterium]